MSIQQRDFIAVEDPCDDDGQLTIRIPNPKVYMARQSQWVGRRGKPRCDYCRSSNLKCDRVLPMCNHCSWANESECKYTPLPTPAHRGIPRCDRCRAANMKCDRNLPICNNCKEFASGANCNYTPKKKNKPRPTELEDSPSKIPLKSGQRIIEQSIKRTSTKVEDGDTSSHTFYGHNVAIPKGENTTPSFSESDSISDIEFSQTGRFTADYARVGSGLSTCPPAPVQMLSLPTPLEFIPHSFPQEQKIVINSSHLGLWTHRSFVSLPKIVCKRLGQLDVVEFPKRVDFDAKLYDFQSGMMEALRETTCIPAEKYSTIADCLASGNISPFSERLQTWVTIHRMCTGSKKFDLILVPRDSVFSMDPATAESCRQQFVADLLKGNASIEDLQAHHYDQLPVMEQIYDILTYAHRSHLPAAQMLLEVVRLRFAFITWTMAELFVKICPLCNMHSDEARSRSLSPSD